MTAGPVTINSAEAYRRWSAGYDETLNPLLALEARLLRPRLKSSHVEGLRILDAGCGTGRWAKFLAALGARVTGIDNSTEMLAAGGMACGCAIADLANIPARDQSFDLALCSFALSYAADMSRALGELVRVARAVLVSDLHPEAMRRGWRRSFHSEGRDLQIRYTPHSIQELDDAAWRAGLTREWRVEAPFGEPEREIFRAAGREPAFATVTDCPAVLITRWAKSSS